MSEKAAEPAQPDPVAQALARQEQINAQIAQSMAQQQKLMEQMSQRLMAPLAPAAPAVLPGTDEYQKGNQKLLDDLVADPASVLARGVSIAEQRAARMIDNAKQEIVANQRAAEIERQFYAAYPDLMPYADWVAKSIERAPAEMPLDQRLVAAANSIRSHLAQRDEWARGQGQETDRARNAASSSGGRPAYGQAGGGEPGGDTEVFDELADRRAYVEEQKAWKANRRKPMPQDAYQRRASR